MNTYTKQQQMRIALTECELQYNFIDEAKHDKWRATFKTAMGFATTTVNPWRIIRDDGVVIASSYDGFTSVEQAARNGRQQERPHAD